VLIAIDGSPSAQAAVATARVFPWPRASRVRGVVVSAFGWVRGEEIRRTFGQAFERTAGRARQRLARRWPDVEVVTIEGNTVKAILGEARRFRANVVIVGWRGHGVFRRLLMGSVSRKIVEQARRPVLVVRRPVREVRRIVVGIDGSPGAQKAVDFVALLPHDGLQVTVVRVVEPIVAPGARLLLAPVRSIILRELAEANRALVREASREVNAAATRLRRAGWTVRTKVSTGAPLASLLEVVDRTGADVLVIGARARSGLERALLGSVAAGALNHSRVPVLVVR
jgi:nucleotide-binding universal stress UspA family protein